MAMDFTKNRFYFPVGTKLKLKEHFSSGTGLIEGVTYTVVVASLLRDQINGNDLEVGVLDGNTQVRFAPAHYFVCVSPRS